MKKTLIIILLLTKLTVFGQKKDLRYGSYSAYLCNVEISPNATLGIIDSLTSTYEDSFLKINWQYAVSQLTFDLKNKSDQTLKIIWDDAAYITMTNETEKVFHKGIKYTDRENSQPATSIYKGANLSDLVAPTSYVSYNSVTFGGWQTKPLIYAGFSPIASKIVYNKNLIGQNMRVVLPIKKDDQTIEYTFIFRTEFIEKKK